MANFLAVGDPSTEGVHGNALGFVNDATVDGTDEMGGGFDQVDTDPIVIPVEKWLPFLKRFRVKPDPRWE